MAGRRREYNGGPFFFWTAFVVVAIFVLTFMIETGIL